MVLGGIEDSFEKESALEFILEDQFSDVFIAGQYLHVPGLTMESSPRKPIVIQLLHIDIGIFSYLRYLLLHMQP